MTRIQRILAAAIFLFVSTGPIWIIPVAAQSARAKQVGMKLKCLCHGCDMAAGICSHPGGAFSGPCETAKGIRLDEARRAFRYHQLQTHT